MNWREVRENYFGQKPLPVFEFKNGLRFVHNHADGPVVLLLEIFDDEQYRPIIKRRTPKTVLDLGANIGFYSVWASKQYPTVAVTAFEPNRDTALRLRANLHENGVQCVTVREEAAAGVNGTATFLADAMSVDSSLQRAARAGQVGSTYEVTTIPLSDCIKLSGQPTVDFCKIDVEGAEVELLQNADDQTLQRVREYAIEVHDDRVVNATAKCVNRLEAAGFRVRTYWTAKEKLSLVKAWRENQR